MKNPKKATGGVPVHISPILTISNEESEETGLSVPLNTAKLGKITATFVLAKETGSWVPSYRSTLLSMSNRLGVVTRNGVPENVAITNLTSLADGTISGIDAPKNRMTVGSESKGDIAAFENGPVNYIGSIGLSATCLIASSGVGVPVGRIGPIGSSRFTDKDAFVLSSDGRINTIRIANIAGVNAKNTGDHVPRNAKAKGNSASFVGSVLAGILVPEGS